MIQYRVKADDELQLAVDESVNVVLERGARVKLWIWCDSADSMEREVNVELEGSDSEAHTHLVFLGRGETQHRFKVRHRHTGENTQSQMHVLGAVVDSSRVSADAIITLEEGSRHASGHLNEHQLILSPSAKIETIPALEIRHNEVSATHKAAVEPVPEEVLFYLQARGLEASLARRLIVEGFFQEALRHAPTGWPAEEKFEELIKKL
jgi:Fe-S cluster assembly protein SufD